MLFLLIPLATVIVPVVFATDDDMSIDPESEVRTFAPPPLSNITWPPTPELEDPPSRLT
jgi:hypothetical protein